MKKSELLKKNKIHEKYDALWQLYAACYEGIKEMIDAGVIKQHERESAKNWECRKEEACSFGYAKTVVDMYHHYLHSKPDKNDYGNLKTDDLFARFQNDCNLEGVSWVEYRNRCQRNASIYGVIGLLVDMGQGSAETREVMLKEGFYPYVSMYAPANILDWEYKRNPLTNRPTLKMLKLKEENGDVVVWTPDTWERYEIKDDQKDGDDLTPIAQGINKLKEIPFVWFENLSHREQKNVGISDLSIIAYLESSIVRDISHANEVIKWAAFPMLMKPLKEINAATGQAEDEDTVGVTGIITFNPEHGEGGKPAWLVPAVSEAMQAVCDWIGIKIKEIFRTALLGDIPTVEGSQQAASGESLKREFQILNALLCNKSAKEVAAETAVIRLWCKWLDLKDAFDSVSISRTDDYSIADLQTDLANVMTAKTVLPIKEFLQPLMKRMVRVVLPGLSEDEQTVLDDAIDAYDFSPVSMIPGMNSGDGNTDEETDNKKDDEQAA